jgi:serine/threonine protein kinase
MTGNGVSDDHSPGAGPPQDVAAIGHPHPPRVGRYIVVGDIGYGTQASVLRVIDPALDRHLVLKLSRQAPRDDQQRRDAVLAEGRLLADLDHPGLVRVFDVGVHDGRPYLVLEHVPGRNLEQNFATRRPSPQEAARFIADLARVVAYAHGRGVVHGDITPRNILIDEDGRTRLIDFGMAKFADAWVEDHGQTGGTPEFLPPEIAPVDGKGGRSLPASDVFGLGAVLYWLLTGTTPFAAPSGREALERARRCDIDLAALRRAGVPRRLVRACEAALACDPAQRPPPADWADMLDRAVRHRRLRAAWALAVAVILVALAGGWWWHAGQENDSPDTQVLLHSPPEITVIRHDEVFALSNVLPLRTGDRLAITCDVSSGEEAVALWFDAAGRLQRLPYARDLVRTFDRLTFPGPNRWTKLEQAAGTEVIVFCRGKPVNDDLIDACFPIGEPPPAIPPHNYLTLKRSRVLVDGPRETAVAEPEEIGRMRTLLKKIDRDLSRYFEGVTAVAFPHLPPSDAPAN